jgi:hypothetical protein
MTKASDNVFPRLLISEGGSTSTPAAAQVTVYAKANGLLYSKDDAGAETALGGGAGDVATDAIWDAAGDLAVGTGPNTAAKLTKGAAGTVPTAGASTLAYAFPPGYELDYVEKTSDTSLTATAEATADTVVTGSSVAYDGSTPVIIEFFAPRIAPHATGSHYVWVTLYDGSSSIGQWGLFQNPAASADGKPCLLSRRLTPSAASHTYSVRAYCGPGSTSGTVYAGVGGSGAAMPAYIRITRV